MRAAAALPYALEKLLEATMRQSHHLLTREELAALIASSACIETRERLSLRETAARLLRRLAEHIAGQKLS
jgi:hypothetical protein